MSCADMLRRVGLEMGRVVLATYYGDGYEYEALVLAPTSTETINLVFVGYGNQQETRLEDIRLISQPRARPTSFFVRSPKTSTSSAESGELILWVQ